MTSASVTRASQARAKAIESDCGSQKDDDVLVAATPTSPEPSNSDPQRDQLLSDSQEDDSSQSQNNPEWLEESSPAKPPSQHQLAPILPSETQGSLVFGEENSSDHAMYAGGETQSPQCSETQPATPEGGWPAPAPEPETTSNKRQSSPPSPPTAKKQKNQRRSPSPQVQDSNSDSFGSGRAAPVETKEARVERLRRERQSELAGLSTAGALHPHPTPPIWDHHANSMPELRVSPAPAEEEPAIDKSASAGSSFEESQRPLVSSGPERLTQPFQATQVDRPLVHGQLSQPSQLSPQRESQDQNSSPPFPLVQHHQNDEESPLAEFCENSDGPYVPTYVLQRPVMSSNSSPNGDISIIPDSEGNGQSPELTQTSIESIEPTQQDEPQPTEQPPAPVLPKVVPETTSVGTANTEVSSGTSGKRYVIPPNRALVRNRPRPVQEEVAWMSDRLPGSKPITADLNLDSAPPVAESSKQGASRQTSPLKKVAAKRTETPQSASPSPTRPLRESPVAEAEKEVELPRQPSLELPSPAKPVTSTYKGTISAKRSRASSSRMNYNEDTEDESDDPIENDESYRPTPPARSQPAKPKRKVSRRSAGSSKAGSVIPSTPESPLPTTKQHRVLGFWAPTRAWYPATIMAVEQTGWTLNFDDGSDLKGAHINEIRCLRVCPGDHVIWTKRKPVRGYVKEEWTGYASNKSSAGPRIYKEVSCVTDLGEVPLKSFSIIPPSGIPPSSALADRIIPPNLLTIFVKSPPPESPARSRVASSIRPTPSLASPMKRTSASNQPMIFAGVAFVITFKNSDDAQIKKVRGMIESLGGVVLSEFYDLFPIPPSFDRGRDGIRVADKARFRTAFCVVDEPSTKPKFLCALATGVPCVSWRYIDDAMSLKMKVDWRSYLVSAGRSERLGTWASQVVNRDWADGYCLAELLENDSVRRPLWGKRVACCLSKKDTTYYPLFPYLLSALGASSVVVVNSFAELDDSAKVSIIIVKDDDAVAAVHDFNGTVGTVEWVKQSTITGGWQA